MAKRVKNYSHAPRDVAIIRYPTVTDPYVFLKTLADSNPYEQPNKYRAAERASGMLSHVQNKLGSREVMAGSLDFLKRAADNERSKEIAFFRDKINKLSGFDGDYIQTLRRQLQQFQHNPSSTNYITFIRYLNEIIQGIERVEKRIKSFLDDYDGKNYGNERKQLNKIALSGANTLLKSLQENRDRQGDYLDEVIRILIIKFMQEQGSATITSLLSKKGSLSVESFTAAAIYLQQSIYKFIIDNPDIINYKTFQKVDINQAVEQLYPTFQQAFLKTSEASIFQKGGHQLENILQEISHFFEITTLEKQARDKGNKTPKRSRSQITQPLNRLLALSGKSVRHQKDMLRRVQIKTNFSNTALGNFKELDSIFAGYFINGINVGSFGGGTDSIYLGDFEISHQVKESDVKRIEEQQERILRQIKDNFSKEKSDTFDQAVGDLNNLITRLNELQGHVKQIQQGFIIHESTKFYQTVEKGKWYNNKAGFMGRKMQIWNYIDSIASLGAGFGINTDWLKFAALNLSGPAFGSGLISPLEKYFTTFIGLVMFDDFELMAKEIHQGTSPSSVSSIHLYKLQDLFFPSSYFLEQTYNRMSIISDELDSGNAFVVQITTPSGSAIESKVQESRAQDWENVRNEARANTMVISTFALNFLSLMSQLNQ